MKSKKIMFYGTKEDLEPIIVDLENEFSFKYFRMGLFDEKKSVSYNSVFEVQEFGKPLFADWNKDVRLIVLPKDKVLNIREVPQKKGGLKFAIDPLENQISICFQFGGIVREGVLLAGTCGTLFLSDFSLEIFKKFSTIIKEKFKKVEDFYVGRYAEEKLINGWRLVTNENSPKEYELSLK